MNFVILSDTVNSNPNTINYLKHGLGHLIHEIKLPENTDVLIVEVAECVDVKVIKKSKVDIFINWNNYLYREYLME